MTFDSIPGFKDGDEETLEMELWKTLAEKNVLVGPGWFFAATDDVMDVGQGHFRISFSNADVCPCPVFCQSTSLTGRV
jgi:aromatic amino acid aminotransferase I / 2-aminoadipate transaminase